MVSRLVWFLASAALLLPLCSQAGHAAWQTPGKTLDEKTQAGDAFSQIRVAMQHEAESDFVQAAKWYRLAADHGESHAQNSLGFLYQSGLGVPQSYEEAVKWYRRSAEQGNPNGQSNLAKMFADGTGVPRDRAEAARLYRQSAEQGWAWAQAMLALMYARGQIGPPDAISAYSWCILAFTVEGPTAQWGCTELMEKLAAEMKPAEISAAKQRAREWFAQRSRDPKHWAVGPHDGLSQTGFATDEQFLTERIGAAYAHGGVVSQDDHEAVLWFLLGADRGDAAAQSDLGERYYNGSGVAKDPARAFSLFKQSAEQGWPWGEHNLATCYKQSIGVTADVREAVRWFEKAGAQGDSSSLHDLAGVYVNGGDVKQDLMTAYVWLRLARAVGNSDPVFHKIEGGLTEAQLAEGRRRTAEWLTAHQDVTGFRAELGYMYWRGEGVAQDFSVAAKLALSAAQMSSPRAQTLLGLLSARGEGVRQDQIQAVKLYRMAADAGDMQAQRLLAGNYERGIGVPKSEVEAIRWYQKAVAHSDEDPLALNNLAMLYITASDASLRNPVKALEYARRATELTGEGEAGVMDTLAEAYYASGDYKNAAATQEKALALRPGDREFQKRLKKYQQAQKN